MADPQVTAGTHGATPARTIPLAVFVAVLVVTVVLASALALLGIRWVTVSRSPSGTANTLPAVSASLSTAAGPSQARGTTTRLEVSAPRRLIDTGSTALAPGAQVGVPLPQMEAVTSAVLLQVSMRQARGPGLVVVDSGAEEVPALRLAAEGAQTSATVVAALGPARTLRFRTEGGGRLIVDLIGTFDGADAATSGRIVQTPATSVVELRPRVDGHDAVIDLGDVPVLPGPQRVSAVMLRVEAQVGEHGGYVAVGPSAGNLDQHVYWSASADGESTRNGFLVVPVDSRRIYLHYKAGTELRAEVVGYVTGAGAAPSSSGLSVPLPGQEVPAVRVSAAGRTDVALVPAAGIAGVTPGRVGAILTNLTATGDAPGAVSVVAPDAATPRLADLSAATRTRSALALAGSDNGTVSVTSQSGASVILTPRLLILR